MESREDRIKRLELQVQMSAQAQEAQPFLTALLPQLRQEALQALEQANQAEVVEHWATIKALRKIEEKIHAYIRETDRNHKLLSEAMVGDK